jgi:hypothetical protein
MRAEDIWTAKISIEANLTDVDIIFTSAGSGTYSIYYSVTGYMNPI